MWPIPLTKKNCDHFHWLHLLMWPIPLIEKKLWSFPLITFIDVTNSTDPKTICDLFHASKITFVTSSMHFQNSVTNSTKTISIWIWLDLKTVEQAIIGSGNGHNFFVTISTANYGLFHKNFECDQFHTWSLVWPFPLFQLCLCPHPSLWPFPQNFLWLITFSPPTHIGSSLYLAGFSATYFLQYNSTR